MTRRSVFDDRDSDRPLRLAEFALGVAAYVAFVYVLVRVVTGLAA